MREPVLIVDAARTALTRSWKGGFAMTHTATLAGAVIAEVVSRSGVRGEEVDDVVLGCANPEGANGSNIARQAALRAGLPDSVPGMTVNRFCASGLQAITSAAQRIGMGECTIVVAGGAESISLVQNEMNVHMLQEEWLADHRPDLYVPMLRTAENVASRYRIERSRQDEFGAESQRRAADAVRRGIFAEEIVPVDTRVAATDGRTGVTSPVDRVIDTDECVRPDTTVEGLAGLRPVLDGGVVTAGTASPFADGAAAVLVMGATEVRRGLRPLGRYVDSTVVGVAPDEMGIGPALAVPPLLARNGLNVADIGLWELNEAFASRELYCMDVLGIPQGRLNVNGGAIALGHPYGCSGARLVGSVLRESRRRGGGWAVVTLCIGGGQGMAALFRVDEEIDSDAGKEGGRTW